MEDNLKYIVSALDSIRRTAKNGTPMWFARDLMEILQYKDWTNFKNVIEKAKIAADNSGVFSSDHFCDFTEEIDAGKGARVKRENCVLSKYACYLVAMNGDVSERGGEVD